MTDINHQLIVLLNKVLKQEGRLRKGNTQITYFCPWGCKPDKRKLEICLDGIDEGSFSCWICHFRGLSVRSLFKQLNVKEVYFNELNKILGETPKKYNLPNEKKEIIKCLPDEFITLSKPSKHFGYGLSLNYLNNRKVLMDDIIRYNIGFCEEGVCKNRLVIPSYDKDGNINFFCARSFYENNFYKYTLPPWNKNNVIGFEIFINWNEPVNIVEGAFDAFAVRNNVIPLFGTTLSFSLKLAIVENKVKRINIILDNDALKQSLDIFERIEDLQNGNNPIDIHLIKLEGKDPSEIGFELMNDLIEKSKPFGFSDLIKTKIELQ